MHLEKERDGDLNDQAVHRGSRSELSINGRYMFSMLDRVRVCVYGLQVQKKADVTVCSISASPGSVALFSLPIVNNQSTVCK